MSNLKSAVFILMVILKMVFPECFPGCQSCSGKNCTICESHYFLLNGNCSPCPFDCGNCNSYDDCTSCKPKKHGLYAKCRFNCDENCLNGECQDDTADCTQCKPGFYGRQCQHNCSFCADERCDLLSCSSGCRDGYYEFNSGVETICVTCSDNCKVCKNRDICHVCNDDFYLFKYNNRVVCVSCPPEISCSEYCVINDCNHCQKLNNSLLCTDCPEGQRLNGETCELNSTPCSQECSTHCDPYGICQGECNDGWSGEKCNEKCFERCLKCSNGNVNNCIQCRDDFYSSKCNKICNSSCIVETNTRTCDHSGICLHGCKQNYWGETCNMSCPVECIDQVCDRNKGTCTRGCKDGHVEFICIQQTTVSQTESARASKTTYSETVTASTKEVRQEKKQISDIIIIGAASGGGFLVLILIIVLAVCLLIRRKKSSSDESDQNEVDVIVDQNLYAKPMKKTAVVQETQDYIYAQPNKPPKLKKPSTRQISKPMKVHDIITIDLDDDTIVSDRAYAVISADKDIESKAEEETDIDEIALEELEEGNFKLIETEVIPPSADFYYNTASLIRSRTKISDLMEYVLKKTDYENEFEKLPKGLTRTCGEALTRRNHRKNRYNGVYAYDATRVVLKSKTYINANYIDGHNESPEYIASLGPTKTAMNGFKDFWEMIWQEESKTIIMLTNLDESGKMKCEQYWPDQGKTKNYHGYKVTCTSEQTYSEFTIRELSLTMHGHESREITQYHYTAWPDRSVPDNVASLIEFRNKVEQTKSQDAGPMVVHCSAGIGRTGTYIALDILMQEGMDENYVDIFGRVMALRGQRGHMVQNLEQYIFLHRCLLYALTCYADPLSVKDIPLIMTDDKVSKQSKIFMKIDKSNISERKSSANKKIMKENRNGADIPNDEYRVRLTHSKHDYINAVYVNGYKTQYKFIVAQTPLQNTVEDFISMLYQEKCACIIDLDDENLNDTSVGQYLPQDGKATKVGHFQVACKNVETMGHIVIRDLTISRTGLHLSGELHLNHYQFKGWNMADKVLNSVGPLFELVNDVENEIKDQRESRPIVIHCLNGADRSCLFCAVSIILEKSNIETKISILNTICQLRSRRKSAFSDIAHYRFCYKCVNNLSKNSDKRRYYNMTQLL